MAERDIKKFFGRVLVLVSIPLFLMGCQYLPTEEGKQMRLHDSTKRSHFVFKVLEAEAPGAISSKEEAEMKIYYGDYLPEIKEKRGDTIYTFAQVIEQTGDVLKPAVTIEQVNPRIYMKSENLP